jgi:hypothetical protein
MKNKAIEKSIEGKVREWKKSVVVNNMIGYILVGPALRSHGLFFYFAFVGYITAKLLQITVDKYKYKLNTCTDLLVNNTNVFK